MNNRQDLDFLQIIHSCLNNNEQKSKITDFITELLNNSFDETLYYLFSITRVIPQKLEMEAKYIEKLNEYILNFNENHPRLFKEFSINKIDNYLNYLFSKGMIPEGDIKEKLFMVNEYYRWLLDLENYNYEKFEVKWLGNHFTTFFKRHYCGSKTLKKFLLDYIKRNPRSDVASTYIRIFELD